MAFKLLIVLYIGLLSFDAIIAKAIDQPDSAETNKANGILTKLGVLNVSCGCEQDDTTTATAAQKADLTESLNVLKNSIAKLNLKVGFINENLRKFATDGQPTVDPVDVRAGTDNISPVSETVPSHENTATSKTPSNCIEATKGKSPTGIYNINIENYGRSLVVCDEEEDLDLGSGWTVIQRRRDGSVDFFRNWKEYKAGFGNLDGEFFIGLEKLHALTTNSQLQELLIVLEDFKGIKSYARYNAFAVGNAHELYAMNLLGDYSGDAGDSLRMHAGSKFSTKDQDNDTWDTVHCAQRFTGAWWYASCYNSNLNGKYYRGLLSSEKYGQGVIWSSFRDNYSLKDVRMMIRPKSD